MELNVHFVTTLEELLASLAMACSKKYQNINRSDHVTKEAQVAVAAAAAAAQ